MSILAYNGGAVVAMKGQDCVAIATDKRYGIQAQTVSTNFPKVYQMGPTLFVGLPGLATDTQTVFQRLKFRCHPHNQLRSHLCKCSHNNQCCGRTFQALVNAADRDAISGWGAVVYIIEKDKITEKHVKTRMD
nr:proteasome subunit beta type-3 [Danaus plexippus plexippus]